MTPTAGVSSIKRTAGQLLPRSSLGYIRLIRQRWTLKRFSPYVATHTYGDRSLSVAIEDPLAQGWYDHDWTTPADIQLAAKLARLRPGATVFDLGAHQGVVALILAGIVGESGMVVAIEATRHNVAMAQKNVQMNDSPNVTVRHAAVAAKEGTVKFAAQLNGHVGETSASFATENVPAVTVDSLTSVYGVPDVVFVDVEGFEQEVLAGATRTFKLRPDWCVEVHGGGGLEEQGGSVEGIIEEFRQRSYCLYVVNESVTDVPQPLTGSAPSGRFHLIAVA